ncbi:hypothetical protein JW960_06865 [candidate division KSB1 bacterium]|nr:hypothetical protein [candidate division KSB1 bacterium]
MPKIRTFTMTIGDEPFQSQDTPKIRGFFASKFSEYVEMHHHFGDDKFVYRYPLIQYKVINHAPIILGIEKGVEILQRIFNQVTELRIGETIIPIREKKIVQKEELFGISEDLHFYRFITPWMALNQRNYNSYQNNDSKKRAVLLQKILIGNLLSMSKSLDYTVNEKILVSTQTQLKRAKLKGNEMNGFTGSFVTNFNIPDYFGLGKSVSRGFGTIQKMVNT